MQAASDEVIGFASFCECFEYTEKGTILDLGTTDKYNVYNDR